MSGVSTTTRNQAAAYNHSAKNNSFQAVEKPVKWQKLAPRSAMLLALCHRGVLSGVRLVNVLVPH